MVNKTHSILKNRNKSKRHGFSLVEIVVIIAVLAIIVAFTAPALLGYVEQSRAQRDESAMSSVINVVDIAIENPGIYDELLDASLKENISCYIDSKDESLYHWKRMVTKPATRPGEFDQYKFGDDARTLDETKYYGAGNMHGVTITFKSSIGSNRTAYNLSECVVNAFFPDEATPLTEYPNLYNAIRQVLGDEIELISPTYRNSDYTIFIVTGAVGGNDLSDITHVEVYGQYSGTNLPAEEQRYYIAFGRGVSNPNVGTDPNGNGDHDHVWVDYVSETYLKNRATCQSPAVYYKSCSGCGLASYETFSHGNKADHKYTSKVTTVANCVTEGVKTYTCSGCDDYYTESIGKNENDHNYSSTVTTPATCTTTGVRTYTCDNGCGKSYTEGIKATGHVAGVATRENETSAACTIAGGYDNVVRCITCSQLLSSEHTTIPALGHRAVEDAAVAPTCTSPGWTAGSHCSVCNVAIVEQTEVPAAGHTETVLEAKAPTCTSTGLTEGKKCTVCNIVTSEQTFVPASGHNEETLAAKEASCTETGLAAGKKCTVCGIITLEQAMIPAKGHTNAEAVNENEVAATCTKTGSYDSVIYCSVCDAEISRSTQTVEMLVHTEVVLSAKPATCTATGLKEGKQCSVCNTITVVQEVVPAKGHTEMTLAAQAATCTATGLTEGKKCSTCGTITVEQNVVPAAGHTSANAVKENEVAATCTETGGYDSVVYCSVCDAEISRVAQTINKLPHTTAVLEAKAATCTETGLLAGEKCSICGTITVEQIVVPAKGHNETTLAAKAATCTESGLTAGKKCVICQTITTAQEVVPANGHTEVTLAAQAATCTATGLKEGKQCSVCDEITVAQEVISAKGHAEGEPQKDNVVGALCGTAGSYDSVVRCMVCNTELSRTKVDVPATGDHNYVTESDRKDATCTEAGYCVMSCSCGATKTTDVAAKGHAEVTLAAQAATCTATGLKEGKQCSVCNEITVEQEVVPAKGHTEVTLAAQAATCTATGLKEGKQCYVCNKITVAQEVIPANGHAEETIPAIAATCVATGLTEGKRCTVCGTVTAAQTIVAAKGHTGAAAVRENEVASTCTQAGGYDSVVYCSVCEFEMGRTVESVEKLPHTEVDVVGAAATCTATGLTDGKKCSVCGTMTVGQQTIAAKGHSETTLLAKRATCTMDGLTEGKKCSVCGIITVAQEVIPATGHTDGTAVRENEVTATCTKTGSYDSVVYCTVCNDEVSRTANIISKLPHSEVAVAGTSATCTKTGLTAGKKCSVCGTFTVAQQTIAATGHSETTLPAKAATCTETGLTAGKQCTVCGTITVAQTEIPAAGHKETTLSAKAATCTETGLTAGKQCTVCRVVTKAQQTVAATGHTSGTAVKENEIKATCTSGGSYDSVVYCKTCSAELSRTSKATEAAGHTIPNVNGKCDNCGAVLAAYALSGKWVFKFDLTLPSATIQQYINYSYGTNFVGSSSDGFYITSAGVDLDVTGSSRFPQYNDGLGWELSMFMYIDFGATAQDVSKEFYEWFVDNADPHKECAHDYVAVVTKPTCTGNGYTTYACSKCDAYYIDDVVYASGHTEETIPAKAATCTATGLTEGKKCSVCGTVTVKQTTISANGHAAGVAVKENEVKSTCTSGGSYDSVVYCETCNVELSRTSNTTAAIGHTTPNANGKCDNCGAILIAYTLSGKWVFKFDLTLPSATIQQYINYSYGTNFVGSSSDGFYITSAGVDLDATGGSKFPQYSDVLGWEMSMFMHIDFGATPQEVSQEFYEWFMINAEPYEEPKQTATVTIIDDFSISGQHTYTYEIGMTWADLVNSSYNTNNTLVLNGDGTITITVGDGGPMSPGWISVTSNLPVDYASTYHFEFGSGTVAYYPEDVVGGTPGGALGTLDVTANGYTGTYDGKAHGITVSCAGATITYATSANGTYSSTLPTYTTVGTYTTYYKVEKDGYETVTGSATVVINKASGKVTLSATSGTLTTGATGSFTVSSNLSGGTLTVKSSNTSVASVSISGSKVTITAGSTAGTATITVTSATNTNYNAAAATYTITVVSASNVYSAGTLVFKPDGIAYLYGENGTVTNTYTGWMTETYSSTLTPWYAQRSNILSVVIEDGVTPASTDFWFGGTRSNYACNKIESVTIGNGLTCIGQYMFGCASGLQNITIPSCVTKIGHNAFYKCTNLTNVIFEDATTWFLTADSSYTEGDRIDVSNPSTAATYLSTYSSKCWYNINLCKLVFKSNGVAYLYDDNNTLTKTYTGWMTEKYDSGSGVPWYDEKDTIDSVVIESGVVPSSTDYWFQLHTNLSNVSIGSGLKSIGKYMFGSCCSLTKIVLSNTITTIGAYAFASCSGIVSVGLAGSGESIEMPSSITQICQGAFMGCTGLKSVTIPDTVTTLGTLASGTWLIGDIFSNCTNLTTVVIGSGIEAIPIYTFKGCSSLSSVKIGENVTEIMQDAFSGCTSLSSIGPTGSGASVELPSSLTTIGTDVFEDCTGLTNVTIPDSVTRIAGRAFKNCSALTSVMFKDTSIWFCTTNAYYNGGTQIDVSNASLIATYFIGDYVEYYWYKQ